MSPFFDDLEAQLRDAERTCSAAQPAPVAPSRRGWLRAGLRSAPVLVAVATTIAVVAAALVLIGHGQRSGPPSGGSPTPPTSAGALFAQPKARLRQELHYMEQATRAMEASPGCHAPPTGQMKTSQGRPSRALTSVLAVLSRPGTAADRLPLSALSGEPEIVYVNYIRRALVKAGVSYYIVPVRSEAGVGIPRRHCLAKAVAALHSELPDIPPALRRPTVALQTRIIASDSRLGAPRDAICFVTQAHNEGGSSCGDSPAEIVDGVALQTDQETVSGVVPDGVGTVTLRYPATGGRPALTVTAGVTGNVFAVRVARAQSGQSPVAIVWRSAEGKVVRRIPYGKSAARVTARQFCRHHPVAACLAALSVSGSASSSSSEASSSSSATAAPPRRK